MAKEKIIGNIDHVVIAVRSIEKAQPFFSELLSTEFEEILVNEELGIRSVMNPGGVELIESTRPDSNVGKFIDRKGEGLYALCFTVEDIDRAKAKAKEMGIRIVGELTIDKGPIKGMREMWLRPQDNFGVYVMVAQGNPYRP